MCRSSSEGWNAPLGWLWTVPTTLKSGGMLYRRKIAWRFPPIVPGMRRSSVITPPSARRIAPNSFGYASFDAPRIIRRVFRRIAVGRWNRGISSSRLRELLLDPLIEVVAEPDEPGGFLARGERKVLASRERDLPLAVEHKEALLWLRQAHLHRALRWEDDGPEVRLARRDRGDDDRVDAGVHDGPAHGHRVGRRPRRSRDDDPVRADPRRDLAVDVDLERADLRDVGGVDDALVQTVRYPSAIHIHPDSHPGLHPVVLGEDLREVRVDLVRHDLREESERAAVDPEKVAVRELERAEDRPVPTYRKDHVERRSLERDPLRLQPVRDFLLEDDLVPFFNRLHDTRAELHRPRDLRVCGDSDFHGSISRICSSPYAITFARAAGPRSISRGFRSRPTTSPPACRTMRTPAATSIARNSCPTSVLWR